MPSYTENMANFEAFLLSIKLSANLLFMSSGVWAVMAEWNFLGKYLVNKTFLIAQIFVKNLGTVT